MNISPETYFSQNNLWSAERLAQHCEHNLVKIASSSRFPYLRLLHYSPDAQWENKWTTFSRMCRGLLIDLQSQKILSYPFTKFFNLDQVPETSYKHLQTLGSFEASEKLDGSMVIPFQDPMTKAFFTTTKGSLDSEQGQFALQFLPETIKNEKLLQEFTPVFELVHPAYPIVVNYKIRGYTPGLYLIGVRHRYANKMLSYKEVTTFAKEYGLMVTNTYSFSSLDEVIDKAKALPVLEEGFVLRFEDEIYVKIKGSAYLKAHRFISNFSEKNLLEYMQEGTEGDLLKHCPEEYYKEVEQQIVYFRKKKDDLLNTIWSLYAKLPHTSRKEFAIAVLSSPEAKPYSKFLFNAFSQTPLDNITLYQYIGETEHLSSRTRI